MIGEAVLARLIRGQVEVPPAPHLDGPAAAQAVDALAAFWVGDFGGCQRAATRAADRAADEVDRLLALAAAELAAAGLPDAPNSLRWEEASMLLAGLPPRGLAERRAAFAGYLLAEAALANARLDVATRTASVAGDWTAAWRDHPFELMLIGTAVRIAAFAGRIDEAAGLLRQLADAGERHQQPGVVTAIASLVSGNADRPDETRALIEALLAERIPPVDYIGRGVHLLAAFGAVAIGDVREASALVQVAGGAGLARLTIVDRALATEVLVVAALADGDADAASGWVQAAAGLAHHRAAQPALDRARSRIALWEGNLAEAVRLGERAVAAAGAEGRTIEQAEGEIVLARARIAGRDVRRATQGLRAGVRTSDAAGHHAMRRSARRVLRTAGRRLPPVSAGGWSVLSERERQVAELVLSGLDVEDVAAELVLSSATVRVYVSRVLHAFGVSSRVGLLALAGPRGEAGRAPARALTPRQQDVARLVSEARSNVEIAEILGLSVKSVEKHLTEAMRRWDCVSRFDLSLLWHRHGIDAATVVPAIDIL